MVGLKTACKFCCFYQNATCSHNLLEKFEKHGADIVMHDGSPIINRICPYFRSSDWNQELPIEEKMSICRNEIYISGTIILIANDSSNLLQAIKKLNANTEISNFKLIVIYKDIKASDMLDVCGNNIHGGYKLIKWLDHDIAFHVYKALTYAKNGYLFILDTNKAFDEKIVDKIDFFVNKQLNRLLHVLPTEGFHESVSMIHIYKWLKGDLQCSFGEKLCDIANKENSDSQVLTWKDIDENYSN
jgi:hypothetical protein